MTSDRHGPTQPWWRFRMVWLVVGGPAIVVAASFATLFLAVRGADRPLHNAASAEERSEAFTPATQARNHAVTPHR